MIYIVTPNDEIHILYELTKKVVELTPTWVDNFDNKKGYYVAHCIENYEYQILVGDSVIFKTNDISLRDEVASNLVNVILSQKYSSADSFIEINELVYSIEKRKYEERKDYEENE